MAFSKKSFELGVVVKGRNQLNPGLSRAASDVRAFGSSITSATTGATNAMAHAVVGNARIATAASAAIMAKFTVDSVRTFAEFEKGMHEVWTLLPDVSRDSLDTMKDQVRDFAEENVMPIRDSITALYQAISAGIVVQPLEFLETAAKAARGGVTNIITATDGLTSAVNSFRAVGLQVEDAADSMFAAVRIGKTTFPQLTSVLGQVAPVAASASISFSELQAALAALTTTGLSTDEAATQLRRTIFQLGKDTTDVSKIFKSIVGQTFPEFVRSGNTLKEALLILQDYAQANETTLLNLFSNIRAGQGATALAVTGIHQYNRALRAMRDQAGAAQAANEKMLDTLNAKLELNRIRWQNAKIAVGEAASEYEILYTILVQMSAEMLKVGSRGVEGSVDILEHIGAIFGRTPSWLKGTPFVHSFDPTRELQPGQQRIPFTDTFDAAAQREMVAGYTRSVIDANRSMMHDIAYEVAEVIRQTMFDVDYQTFMSQHWGDFWQSFEYLFEQEAKDGFVNVQAIHRQIETAIWKDRADAYVREAHRYRVALKAELDRQADSDSRAIFLQGIRNIAGSTFSDLAKAIGGSSGLVAPNDTVAGRVKKKLEDAANHAEFLKEYITTAQRSNPWNILRGVQSSQVPADYSRWIEDQEQLLRDSFFTSMDFSDPGVKAMFPQMGFREIAPIHDFVPSSRLGGADLTRGLFDSGIVGVGRMVQMIRHEMTLVEEFSQKWFDLKIELNNLLERSSNISLFDTQEAMYRADIINAQQWRTILENRIKGLAVHSEKWFEVQFDLIAVNELINSEAEKARAEAQRLADFYASADFQLADKSIDTFEAYIQYHQTALDSIIREFGAGSEQAVNQKLLLDGILTQYDSFINQAQSEALRQADFFANAQFQLAGMSNEAFENLLQYHSGTLDSIVAEFGADSEEALTRQLTIDGIQGRFDTFIDQTASEAQRSADFFANAAYQLAGKTNEALLGLINYHKSVLDAIIEEFGADSEEAITRQLLVQGLEDTHARNVEQLRRSTENARLAAERDVDRIEDLRYNYGEITKEQYISILEQRVRDLGGRYTVGGSRAYQALRDLLETEDQNALIIELSIGDLVGEFVVLQSELAKGGRITRQLKDCG